MATDSTPRLSKGDRVILTMQAKTVLPERLTGTIVAISGDGKLFTIEVIDGTGNPRRWRRRIAKIASIDHRHTGYTSSCHRCA